MTSPSSQWVVGNSIHTLRMLRHTCTTKQYKTSDLQTTWPKKPGHMSYLYVDFF